MKITEITAEKKENTATEMYSEQSESPQRLSVRAVQHGG